MLQVHLHCQQTDTRKEEEPHQINQSKTVHTYLYNLVMANDSSIFNRHLNNSNHTISVDIPQYVLYKIYAFNGILVLLGVLGNTLVCWIITRGKKMYTVANLYLMNLAIADLFILVFSYPLWILQSLLPYGWPFGSSLCKIVFPLSDVFYGASLGCMMAISIHRYRKIIHSKGPQMKFIHAKAVVIFFYGISILTISAPVFPIMQYTEQIILRNVTLRNNDTKMAEEVRKQCSWHYPTRNYETSHMLFLTIAWYITPLLIILFTFVRIKCYLQRKMRYHWISKSKKDLAVKSRVEGIRKALRLLAPVVIVFAILMLPWNVLRVISVFEKQDYKLLHNQIFSLVASTMLVINSVVNPFIYYITSNDFRLEFRNQFRILLKFFKLTNEGDKCLMKIEHVGRERRCSSFLSTQFNSSQVNEIRSPMTSETHSVNAGNRFANGVPYPNFDELFKLYQNGEYNLNTNRLPEEVIVDDNDTDMNNNIEMKLHVKTISENIFGEKCLEEYKETDL